jgi:hypothetical protein
MDRAAEEYNRLKDRAEASAQAKAKTGKSKTTKDEGLFKQVHKTIEFLRSNPKHPGLRTHPYDSIPHPYDDKQKVFEAYAQNNTPGAYRVFWCYGPKKGEMTIIAITPHP